jgi:hypothetical protein
MKNALKTENLYDSHPKKIIYLNSVYKVHQVGPKESIRSQNFSFLIFEGKAAGVAQNLSYARDRRKILYAQIMCLVIKSPKTCKSAIKKIKPILPSYFICAMWQVKNAKNL